MHTRAACVKSQIHWCKKESASLMQGSCYSGRHINRHVGLRLLCFALQVLVKPHKHTQIHTHAHTLTAAGADVVMLGCVHTESRLARECVYVCVSWLWAFFFLLFFFLQGGSKSGRTCAGRAARTVQKVRKYCCRGWFWRKGGWKIRAEGKQRSLIHANTHAHTHIHKRNESSVSMWKGFERL